MRTSVVWFRRDLRCVDQPALLQAARRTARVVPVFVLDPRALADFTPGSKPQGYFFGTLIALRDQLRRKGSELILLQGDPEQEIPEVCRELGASEVHWNKDYEPRGRARDEAVASACRAAGIEVHALKDHVLHEESEVLNGSGAPYRIFTPYRNASLRKLRANPPEPLGNPRWSALASSASARSSEQDQRWRRVEATANEGLKEAGIDASELGEPASLRRLRRFVADGLSSYSRLRDYPARAGTSRLSADLRCGAVSPRKIWAEVSAADVPASERDAFLRELLWRDFFIMIGFHDPRVFEGNCNRTWDRISWRNDESEFRAWCEGRTGYPIVDAGMRELVRTGFMHNRARMITAMFLVKDLLVDWRRGERFFREHLIDGDLAVNNGNWQWCASTGSDAQPYFRVFNPAVQGRKFDRELRYVRSNVPEYGTSDYPAPIVDHAMARMRTLVAYRKSMG
jgi:deoxyribodipyrimidine photo-lyase